MTVAVSVVMASGSFGRALGLDARGFQSWERLAQWSSVRVSVGRRLEPARNQRSQEAGLWERLFLRRPHQSAAVKSIDSFDFLAIPSLNKMLVLEPARCDDINRNENVIAVGNSGTGKTHIALALGLEACRKGRTVGFITASTLVHDLLEARDKKRLLKLQKQLARPRCHPLPTRISRPNTTSRSRPESLQKSPSQPSCESSSSWQIRSCGRTGNGSRKQLDQDGYCSATLSK